MASLLAEIKNDGKQIEELRVGVGRGKRIIAGGLILNIFSLYAYSALICHQNPFLLL